MEKERDFLESKLKTILEGIDDFNQAQKKLEKEGYEDVVVFMPQLPRYHFGEKDYQFVQIEKSSSGVVYEGLLEEGNSKVHFYFPEDKLSEIF